MKDCVVFTGGGTLGHVMPNLYLINELKPIANCSYIGSNGIEKEKVQPQLKEKYFCIPATKLVRGKVFSNLKIPFVLINSIFKAKKILKRLKPKVVFSKGGYVALPVCIAAKMLKIPIIAHESDYSFGLANKIILSMCTTMCVNFKNLENKNKKIKYTGAILSKDFNNNTKQSLGLNLNPKLPTMLIVGGSLGAKSVNLLVFEIIENLLHHINIIHITGKGNMAIKSHKNYNAVEMFNSMPAVYNLADFVLGRSGAGVTAECFYKKLPMLLIPLENKSSRGDQVQNATYFKNLRVAKIVHQQNLTPKKLQNEILTFATNLNNYKSAYNTLPQKNGLNEVVGIIKKYLH